MIELRHRAEREAEFLLFCAHGAKPELRARPSHFGAALLGRLASWRDAIAATGDDGHQLDGRHRALPTSCGGEHGQRTDSEVKLDVNWI